MDPRSEPPDRPSTDRLPGGERLGALLRVLDIPGRRLDPMVVAFPDELKAYAEFSVSDQDRPSSWAQSFAAVSYVTESTRSPASFFSQIVR